MKNRMIWAVGIIAVLTLTGCGLRREARVSAGQLDTYDSFVSKYVPARTIRVWKPADYDTTLLYDVLYMHDGQMLYDSTIAWNHQEWGVDEAMDSLIRMGHIRPTIVVGIDNNSDNRIGEYCPDDISFFLPDGKSVYVDFVAKGNDYLRFLVEELKPFIDSIYSTNPERDHTWVMGSSCGGLISSYALCRYPDVFGGAACMSTHVTLAYPNPAKPDKEVMTAYREYLRTHLTPNESLIYMDQGNQTLDFYYADAQAELNKMFKAEGWDVAHYVYRFFPGHAHCEDDWKARLDIPLTFLLGVDHDETE